MRKCKSLLVLELGIVLIFGLLVSLNAQERYKLKEADETHAGIQQVKGQSVAVIRGTNNLLDLTLREVERMTSVTQIDTVYIDNVVRRFENRPSYLKEEAGVAPILQDEHGATIVTGWAAILRKFFEYSHPSSGTHKINRRDTAVTLDYLAYDLVGKPPLVDDKDLKMHIKTSLDIASPEVFICGDLLHRRLCDPY